MLRTAGMILMLTAGSASAQTVMDGSDADLPDGVAKAAMKAVMDQLVDPYSAQFDRFSIWSGDPGSACGRVNAKNKMGGYGGFQPFRYIVKSDTAFIHANTGCK